MRKFSVIWEAVCRYPEIVVGLAIFVNVYLISHNAIEAVELCEKSPRIVAIAKWLDRKLQERREKAKRQAEDKAARD